MAAGRRRRRICFRAGTPRAVSSKLEEEGGPQVRKKAGRVEGPVHPGGCRLSAAAGSFLSGTSSGHSRPSAVTRWETSLELDVGKGDMAFDRGGGPEWGPAAAVTFMAFARGASTLALDMGMVKCHAAVAVTFMAALDCVRTPKQRGLGQVQGIKSN